MEKVKEIYEQGKMHGIELTQSYIDGVLKSQNCDPLIVRVLTRMRNNLDEFKPKENQK